MAHPVHLTLTFPLPHCCRYTSSVRFSVRLSVTLMYLGYLKSDYSNRSFIVFGRRGHDIGDIILRKNTPPPNFRV